MSAKAKKSLGKKRHPRTVTPVRHRENTSSICLFPHQVADELLISEEQVYRLMALGVEQGGLRAICLGDPASARPRKVVHREDFALYVRHKRGLTTREQYLAELTAAGGAP
jgi:hypothetical protein